MKKIKAGIIGGAGYTGGELIRLLLNHPYVETSFVCSRSNAGKLLSDVHTDLFGETSLTFTQNFPDNNINQPDVLFLCAGQGEAKKFLEENEINSSVKVIDLSQDFRLQQNANFANRHFIYGLPELNKAEIQSAKNIANPGCFATAIQLGLLPLAKAGTLNEIYTTGITGSTGAGQGLSATSHFSWRANNIQAYKSLSHQHLHEIYQSLYKLSGQTAEVNFVPWRGDFTRGIFITSTITCNSGLSELVDLYKRYYSDHPFTVLSEKEISLKQVINTNKCIIHLEKVSSKLVVHSAIDNLLKGASGQAVQNMNLTFGLDECAGLNLKASAF